MAAGLGTFLIRFSFIYLIGRAEFPPTVTHMLKYIPPAVLSALVWPALVLSGGHISIGPANYRLWAGLVAVLVAWKTKNTILTITAGMVSLWLMQWLMG